MKLPSRKKLLGACFVSVPFLAIVFAAAVEFGLRHALMFIACFAGFVMCLGSLYVGVRILSDD